MKRLFYIMLCLFLCVSLAFAGTPDKKRYGTRYKNEAAAHATPPDGYVDVFAVGDIVYTKNDAGTSVAISSGLGDNTLDAAYDQGGAGLGKKIEADSGAVEIEVDDASNNGALLLDFDDVTNNNHVLTIENAGSGADIVAPSYSLTAGAIVATSATLTTLTATNHYMTAISSAAAGNVNITLDAAGTGTIGIGNTSTGNVTITPVLKINGDSDIGNAASDTLTITSVIDANVTLDDGVTASPSLILKDATDETATFSKVDAGYLTVTTDATDGLNVLTGNLKVGNGSPGVSLDGEDAYIEGTLEVDAATTLDGALTTNGTMLNVGNVTLDDGSGASPSLTFTDATDETAAFSKVDSGYLTVTTAAADGVNVLVGNLKVGDGSPGQTINGEDFYCEGISEFDGAITADGTLTVAGDTALNEQLAITLDTNDEEVNITADVADYAAGAGVLTIYDDSTGQANTSYLARFAREADGDANDGFILCQDNSTGAAANGDDMFKVDATGAMTVAGASVLSGTVTLSSDLYVAKGSDAASAGELDLTTGTFFDITGTTNITSIAAADSIAGRLIVLQFDGILTFTDGNNLKIAGNFVTSADDTITLISDGTNWWEVSRSAN